MRRLVSPLGKDAGRTMILVLALIAELRRQWYGLG